MTEHEYDYDYLVIGGGSGGLASAKRAAAYGAKVAGESDLYPSSAIEREFTMFDCRAYPK
jgi:succinate dehydrogenase/fumarate reductase flavoprotein subunit